MIEISMQRNQIPSSIRYNIIFGKLTTLMILVIPLNTFGPSRDSHQAFVFEDERQNAKVTETRQIRQQSFHPSDGKFG